MFTFTDRFCLASCNCEMRETGDFCNETLDLCDVIKCHPGVKCGKDDGSSNPCGLCPDGMIGNGISCDGNRMFF